MGFYNLKCKMLSTQTGIAAHLSPASVCTPGERQEQGVWVRVNSYTLVLIVSIPFDAAGISS